MKKTELASFILYESDQIILYCGDFFALKQELFPKKISMVYDRAALIALPKDLHRQYVANLLSFSPSKLDILLITIDYENEHNSPPYLVTEAELNCLYGNGCTLTRLGRFNNTPVCEQLKQRNFISPHENVYWIQKSNASNRLSHKMVTE